jgi:DNA-binding XRE family transcriptional regulator
LLTILIDGHNAAQFSGPRFHFYVQFCSLSNLTSNILPSIKTIPFEVSQSLVVLGQRVKKARMRRQLSQEELAQACKIARRTLFSIEAGAPGIAVGHIYTVLWKLGLLATTRGVADPDADEHGKILEAAKLGKRVRRPQDKAEDNNF